MQRERNHQQPTSAPLQNSEALLRAMIENLPRGAAFVVDRDLRYLLVEGEALATAGFKPEDFVGRTIFEVIPPELVVSYESMYRQALAGEPFEHEHTSHGRTYISRGTPLQTENGTINAVLVVSYDITDRKRREANLTFLADLMNDFALLATAEEVMEMAGKRITEHLDLSRYMFVEIFPEAGTCPICSPVVLPISLKSAVASYSPSITPKRNTVCSALGIR